MAGEKTEAVVLVGRRAIRNITFNVGETQIQTPEFMKYLGVIFNKNGSMTEHINYVREKCVRVSKA